MAERGWGRRGTPEEIAAVVALPCSDAAGDVNGVALPVDGGMSLQRRAAGSRGAQRDTGVPRKHPIT